MSVSIDIKVSGSKEFAQVMSRLDRAMQQKVQEQLTGWAESVKSNANRLVPIRTGYLQSTIFVKIQNWQVQTGADAQYAEAVEFGTMYLQAQPYLRPAVEANLPRLERLMRDALNQAKVEAQL